MTDRHTTASGRGACWYVKVDDTVYGPFDAATLDGYVAEGRVVEDSLLRQGETGQFRTLAEHRQDAARALRSQLVMADIRSGRSVAFLQTLQALGEVRRIGDTLWLLSTRVAPDDVLSTVTAMLGGSDRVLVLAADGVEAAAFNIGAEIEAALRDWR